MFIIISFSEKGLPLVKVIVSWKLDNKKEHNINKHLNNRDGLFRYFVDLHNSVNMRKDKKIVSYKEAYNIFSDKKWTYKLSKYAI